MKTKKLGVCLLATLFTLAAAGCSADKDNKRTKELEERISALEAELESKNGQVSRLESELAETKAELDDKKTSISEAEQKIQMMESGAYSVKVTDIDGEVLANEIFYVSEYETLWDAMAAKMNLVGSNGWITSVAGTIQDYNWSPMLYENGVQAVNDTAQTVKLDKGDQFEIKMECWAEVDYGYGKTFADEYEALIDKAIYHYAKNQMKTLLAKRTTYADSAYWIDMSVNLMASNNYDTSVFNVNSVTDAFKESVASCDTSELTGANLAKYFYAARNLGQDLTEFEENYKKNGLDTLTKEDGTLVKYSEYTTPFILAPAYSLGLADSIPAGLKNTEYRAGTTYGTDGLCWQYTQMALYNEMDPDELENLKYKESMNDVSAALFMMPEAAFNVDMRSYDIRVDGQDVDYIKLFMDTYFDKETMQFDIEKKANNMSSCQIYASLMAYKVQRDKQKAANIFA